MDGPQRRSSQGAGEQGNGRQATGGFGGAARKTATGHRALYYSGNAAEGSGRSSGVQRGSGEVARVSGTEEVEGVDERLFVATGFEPVIDVQQSTGSEA